MKFVVAVDGAVRCGAVAPRTRSAHGRLTEHAWQQPIWATRVKRLKVGLAWRFSSTIRRLLIADLRAILAPQHIA